METNNPMLSIIVPVYNAENYIERCLSSIVNQTYRNLQIIVVDDGSVDGSGAICDSFSKDDRVTVIHQENKGVSAARNRALCIAKGEYIGFVDADDYVLKDMAYQAVEKLVESDCDVYIFRWLEETKKGVLESGHAIQTGKKNKMQLLHDLVEDRTFLGFMWNKIMRRTLLDGLFFDENCIGLEDMMMLFQIFPRIEQGYITEQSHYVYNRINETNFSHSSSLKKHYDIYKGNKERYRISTQFPDIKDMVEAELVLAAYRYLVEADSERMEKSDLTYKEIRTTFIEHYKSIIFQKNIRGSVKRNVLWYRFFSRMFIWLRSKKY